MTQNMTNDPSSQMEPATSPYGAPVAHVVTTQPPAELIGRTYEHVYAGLPGARWRSVVAIVLLVIGFLVVNIGVSFGVVAVEGMPQQGRLTPMLLAATAVSLALLTPMSFLIQRVLFPGAPSLSSVAGRFRWSLLGSMALFVVPIMVVYMTLFTLGTLPAGAQRSADWLAFALVSVFLIPFQSAGEEYGFRGLINRCAAAWSTNPKVALVLGAVVSSAIFMLAHVATDVWLSVYYFVFGLCLIAVARLTGGLEGGVLLHVANNVTAMLLGALFMDLGSMFNRGPGTGGPFLLIQMAVIAALSALMVWVARREAAEVTT